VFAVHVRIDHAAAERSRSIKGVAGDQIADVIRPHPLEQLADAIRFKLEHALGITLLEQGISLGIIERESLEVDLQAACFLDQLYGVFMQGDGMQTEAVSIELAALIYI